MTAAGPDDLSRILTYAGAVDDRTGVDELGADLLVVPFWTPEFCAAVVRAAELVGFAPDPDDPVPGHEVSLATISPQLYAAVQDDLGARIWPAAPGGLAADRLPRPARRLRHPLRPGRAGGAAGPPRRRPGLGHRQARRRPRRRRAALSPPGGRQPGRPRRRAAGVAVARHPSARGGAAATGREARPDDLVRAAVQRAGGLTRAVEGANGRHEPADSLVGHGGEQTEARRSSTLLARRDRRHRRARVPARPTSPRPARAPSRRPDRATTGGRPTAST